MTANKKFTIYRADICNKCDATKRAMDKQGLEYEVLRAEDHQDIVEEVRAEIGSVVAPIVIAPDGSFWTDYRPDMVKLWSKSLHLLDD